ncbi:TonB-dependent receptor [Prolixibacteraceae bacterium Z1-6]|uniref:TonB-dependent receptor n=1 Tax=Draconibacterium aestuarii TaxID=2998507 RepID=A0A9X3FC46_9BACT|nr:TonB-dependent receptor [Prolixibacteraceae bacterium Z1-6]
MRLLLLFAFTILVTSNNLWAVDATNPNEDGVVKGKIFDGKSKEPIEYATVALYQKEDDSVVTGTITNENGEFQIKGLKPGSFYIEVSFLGYENKRFNDVSIERAREVIDLGPIDLGASPTEIEAIDVVSQRQSVEYKIDKKIVSVGSQMTSASLSAVEVLENVPSIRVDIEGNVSLRGSTGFTVLIDGKPTIMEPSDVLRQTPASTIENIEIITNPSAKYQPDGTGGIINIITKKNRMQGVQGLFNAKGGSFGMKGGDFLLNYRKNKLNFNLGADYNDRPFPGTSFSERRTTAEDGTTTVIKAYGDDKRGFEMMGLRGGLDWDITEKDVFTVGFRVGDFNMYSNSTLDYITTEIPDKGEELRELSMNEGTRGGTYYSLTTNYTHKFEEKGHEFAAQLNYRYRKGDESSENILKDGMNYVTSGTKTTEFGPSGQWELRLDYTKPLGDDNRLEAGFQGRRSTSEDEIELYFWQNGGFEIQPDKGNITEYDRNIMALYSTFNGNAGKFGYQLGLRGEYTYRDITTQRDNQNYTIDRFDLFPTAHFSYQLTEENQLMGSYSRRIDRPRGYYLEPFITWEDMFNVRQGNPDLLPEYIDALEAGYLKSWDKTQLSFEGFYRVKHNKVERIQSVYDDGILLTTFANVGTDYSTGGEFMFTTPLYKWWEINIMGDFYDYRIKGVKYDEPFERSSFNWSARMSNTFRIKKNMQLQFDGNYNSATITSQGRTEDFYMLNAAYRVDLFDRKVSAVVQVRDIFNTGNRVSITKDPDFYNYTERTRNAPMFSFTLSYRLNNFMQKRNQRGSDGGDSMEEF